MKVKKLFVIIGGAAAIGVGVSGGTYIIGHGGSSPGGGAGTANVFIGASGTCTRSSSPVTYNAATSCATPQAAYNTTFPADTIGWESGNYVTAGRFEIDANTSNGKPGTSPVTFVPDGGVVTLDGLALGNPARNKTAPNYVTIDGGASKEFHFGDATHGQPIGAWSRTPSFPPASAPDHITFTRLIIGYKSPTAGPQVFLDQVTNSTLSYSQLGPTSSGNVIGSSPPVASASPAHIIFGGNANQTAPLNVPHNLTISHNTFLGETRDSTTYWPTATYGPAPQPNCASFSTCHADCIHSTGVDGFVFDHNIMYGCDVQGLFLEQQNTGYSKDVTITNNYFNSFNGGHSVWINCNCSGAATSPLKGTWIIAGNTSSLIQINGAVDAAAHVYIVGNRGGHGMENSNLSNTSCFPDGQTTNYTYLYNAFTAVATCGTGDISGAAFGVIDSTVWPSTTTNYDLAGASGSQAGENLVPPSTCATYIGGTDVHDTVRPQNGNCDAGGFERS